MRYDKLAPGLALALEDYREEGNSGLIRHASVMGVVAPTNDLTPPRIPVFLFCDKETDLSDLEEHGIQVNENRGQVRTAFLPIESIDRLTEKPGIQPVAASHTPRPAMDTASVRCSLPAFRNRTNLTGKGVLIGIVDTGIDS